MPRVSTRGKNSKIRYVEIKPSLVFHSILIRACGFIVRETSGKSFNVINQNLNP